MAVLTSYLAPTNTSDTTFRAWISGVHAGILNSGIVQTADTGQVNFGTVLAPVASTTFTGFAMYAFNDALQATSPFFIRIDFGSGGAAVNPAIKVQIGTGTDGAGTLTGNINTQRTLQAAAAITTASACYFSGTTSRLTFVLWPVTNYNLILNIERSVDSSGANTDTGCGYRGTYGSGNGVSFQQFVPKVSLGVVPNAEPTWLAFGSQNTTSAGQNLSSISGLRQAYGPLNNPELGLMSCAYQFAQGAEVTITRYGTPRTYFCLYLNMAAGSISYAQIPQYLMLWE